MNNKLAKRLLASALFALLPAVHADEPTSIWLAFDTPTTELSDTLKTKTNVELRFPDMDSLGYVRFCQKFNFKLNEKWTLGTHPVFENSKSGDEWKYTYRLDMELNPAKIKLGDKGPSLSMRNRWELRWKEGKGSEIFHRIRQRSILSWDLENSVFSSYKVGNEIFFEEDKGKVTANRFYPLMLSTKHGETKASYYLMYQSKRAGTTSNWSGEYILGASYGF